MPRWIDETGNRYNRWVLVEYRRKSDGKMCWWARCDCGTERFVDARTVRTGWSKSCGCYHSDEVRERLTLHGQTGTRLHRIWMSMLERCNNPKVNGYKNYGGRGIKVCDDWLNFQNFYKDMASSYVEGLTIERMNNDKGYQPDNCIWIPRSVQSKNRRPSSKWQFKEEAISSNKSTGIRYIYVQGNSLLVRVKNKNVGMYKSLDQAIKAKEEYIRVNTIK